jgi:hypothetical protein
MGHGACPGVDHRASDVNADNAFPYCVPAVDTVTHAIWTKAPPEMACDALPGAFRSLDEECHLARLRHISSPETSQGWNLQDEIWSVFQRDA